MSQACLSYKVKRVAARAESVCPCGSGGLCLSGLARHLARVRRARVLCVLKNAPLSQRYLQGCSGRSPLYLSQCSHLWLCCLHRVHMPSPSLSLSPSVYTVCNPAGVASLYALPQASAPSQYSRRVSACTEFNTELSKEAGRLETELRSGLVSPQTWIRLTCKASTKQSVDARRCACGDDAMTVQ